MKSMFRIIKVKYDYGKGGRKEEKRKGAGGR